MVLLTDTMYSPNWRLIHPTSSYIFVIYLHPLPSMMPSASRCMTNGLAAEQEKDAFLEKIIAKIILHHPYLPATTYSITFFEISPFRITSTRIPCASS